jgi:hypothetical protein
VFLKKKRVTIGIVMILVFLMGFVSTADAVSNRTWTISRNTTVQTAAGVSNSVGGNTIAMNIQKFGYSASGGKYHFMFKVGVESILDNVLNVQFDNQVAANYRCRDVITLNRLIIEDPGGWLPITSGEFLGAQQDNNENLDVGTSTIDNMGPYFEILSSAGLLLIEAAGVPVTPFHVVLIAASLWAGWMDPNWGTIFDGAAELRFQYADRLQCIPGSSSVYPTQGPERTQQGAWFQWHVPTTHGTYTIKLTAIMAFGHWKWCGYNSYPVAWNPVVDLLNPNDGTVSCSMIIKVVV